MKATTRDHVLIIYLRKQMERDNDLGDRPATDVQEIEVTPEMVEAGLDEFREHRYEGDVRHMLESVFRAMAYAYCSASPNRRSR